MKFSLRAFWYWLKKEKEAISSITAILNTIAVLAGIFYASYEYVYKDREAERMRVTNSFEIFRGESGFKLNNNLGELWMEFVGVTDEEKIKDIALSNAEVLDAGIETAIRRYTEIQACLKTHTCDEGVIRHLFCGEAFFDSFVAYKLLVKPPGWDRPNYDKRLDDLFDFTLGCLRSNDNDESLIRWNGRRNKSWDPVLGEIFDNMDSRWKAAATQDTK